MANDDKSNFLRFEVPGFGRDEYGEPMTSTLRLGAVGRFEGQLGALLLDPGEDLSHLVNGFFDDRRLRCDPPSLDNGSADQAPAPPRSQSELARMKAELEQARKLATELRESLDAVIPDPDRWVDNLMTERAAAVEAVAAEQKKLDAALAAAARVQRSESETDRRVPPSHCAPGWMDPDDIAPDPDATPEEEGTAEDGETGEEEEAPEQPPYTPYVHKIDRRQQSERLHTLGGWRDHTDGNRITTTRGDKVEVVGGNYRLVVLGRQDEPTDADGNPVLPGWEISGGHLDQTDATRVVPETNLSWRQRWSGNWYSYEEHIKGDIQTTSTGDTEEQTYGHHLLTVVGSESPHRPWHEPEDCPGGRCRTNPKIFDRTWAELLETTTGSEKCPIPKLTDHSWINEMITETHAETLDDSRTAKEIHTTTRANVIEDETRCGTMVSTTHAGTITDETTVGLRKTVTTSALMLTANFGRTVNQVFGTSWDVFGGARNNVSLAGGLDVTAAAQLSAFIGIKAELTAAATLTASLTKTENINVGPSLESNLGTVVKIAPCISLNGVNIHIG